MQKFCVEWVELSHKHTLECVLVVSKNMDCAEADAKQWWTVPARFLKQVEEALGYSTLVWPSLRRMI